MRTGETSRFFPHSSAFFVSCQLVGAKHLEKHVSQLPIIYLPNASPVQLSVVSDQSPMTNHQFQQLYLKFNHPETGVV
ncbi:MAG: hypothetical protein ACK5OU_07065 [Dolichospermum sp.]